jgi:hypothetical protein
LIIFINGPFGVGKSTVAEKLHEAIPNSLIFDPEEVGSLLGKVLAKIDPKPDFQEYALWPKLSVEVAGHLKREYGRDLIIPMTLYDVGRFNQVVKGLRTVDSDFHHFCLLAAPQTILYRISDRTSHGARSTFYPVLLRSIQTYLIAGSRPIR